MSDRIVLTMDGSTRICSAALMRVSAASASARWDVLARRSEANGRGQSKVLLRLVDEMLEQTGAQPGDLGSIVVGIGPGTFTGVRIAVATARGLALALSVPVLGVSTLTALAVSAVARASEEDRASWSGLVPVVDARRQQVFYAVYEASGLGGRYDGPRWTQRRPIAVCDQGSLGSVLTGEHMDAVAVMGEWLQDGAGTGAGSAVNDECPQDLAAVGSPETVKPIYVRAPDADIHITKMKDPWADGRNRR
jgi:tRNA threonylcarbamoyladenosine biosynthesis protein TsaB